MAKVRFTLLPRPGFTSTATASPTGSSRGRCPAARVLGYDALPDRRGVIAIPTTIYVAHSDPIRHRERDFHGIYITTTGSRALIRVTANASSSGASGSRRDVCSRSSWHFVEKRAPRQSLGADDLRRTQARPSRVSPRGVARSDGRENFSRISTASDVAGRRPEVSSRARASLRQSRSHPKGVR